MVYFHQFHFPPSASKDTRVHVLRLPSLWQPQLPGNTQLSIIHSTSLTDGERGRQGRLRTRTTRTRGFFSFFFFLRSGQFRKRVHLLSERKDALLQHYQGKKIQLTRRRTQSGRKIIIIKEKCCLTKVHLASHMSTQMVGTESITIL